MKRLLLIIITVLTFFACNNSKGKNEVQPQKKSTFSEADSTIIKTKGLLVCQQNIFKNRILKKGDTLRQKFLLINKGIEPVEILGYTTSCNCTSINATKTIVKPKDSIYIEMTMDSHEKLIGKDKITATLTTNGKRKFYFLSVSFEIK